MKKKVILLPLVAFMLASCGGNPGQDSGSGDGGNPSVDVVTFQISFYDEEGNLLETKTVNEGSLPSYSYVKADDAENTYEFKGWSKTLGGETTSLSAASENTSYYAVVEKKEKTYEVDFEQTDLTTAKVKSRAVNKVKTEYESTKSKAEVSSSYKLLLDAYYTSFMMEIYKFEGSVDELKNAINEEYNNFKRLLVATENISETVEDIKDTAVKAITSLKNVIDEIGALSNQISAQLDNVKSTIEQLSGGVTQVKTVVEQTLLTMINVVKPMIVEMANTLIVTAKNTVVSALNSAFDTLLEKIPDGNFKTTVQDKCDDLTDELDEIDTVYKLITSLEEVKEEGLNYVEEAAKDFVKALLKDAKDFLDEKINPLIDQIDDEELKEDVEDFYETEMDKLVGIDSIDAAKSVLETIKSDTTTFIQQTASTILSALKSKAINELNNVISTTLLEKITDTTLKGQLTTFLTNETNAINNIDNYDELLSYINGNGDDDSLKDRAEDLVVEIINGQCAKLKAAALTEISNLMDTAIAKLPDGDFKTELQDFKEEQLEVLDSIDSLDSAKSAIETIKTNVNAKINEVLDACLIDLKNKGLDALETFVDPIIAKLPDGNLKTGLVAEYNEDIATINAINSVEGAPAAIEEVITSLKDYVKETVASTYQEAREQVASLVTAIGSDLKFDIVNEYIPEAMRPAYASNLVSLDDVSYDFENSFVNVSDLKVGFGEQWNMVLDTLDTFSSFLKYIDGGSQVISNASTAILAGLNDDFGIGTDYAYENDIFKASVSFDDDVLNYSVEVKTEFNVPVIGSIKPSFEVVKTATERTVTITLGENNKMKYVISDSKLEMAAVYGLDVGQRTAMLTIEDVNDVVKGTIDEQIKLGNSEVLPSRAEFYINDDYVTVIGNKADGMLGFNGYINELYNKNVGKLIGYEVMETKAITFNTLWFNLVDVSGISNIKAKANKNLGEYGNNNHDIYLNNSSTIFTTAKMGITHGLKAASRRFDIELRKNFFYYLDNSTSEVVKKYVLVPMFFVQEEVFETVHDDISDKNSSLDISVTLNSILLNKIMDDYDTYVSDFSTSTGKSSQDILDWLE